jgi:hypothetical protein
VYDELIEVYRTPVQRGLTRQVSWSDDPEEMACEMAETLMQMARKRRREAGAPAALRWRERSMTCSPWQTNSSRGPVRVAARRRRLLVVLRVGRNSFAVPAISKSWAKSIQIVIAGSVKLSGCGSRSRFRIARASYASSGVREGRSTEPWPAQEQRMAHDAEMTAIPPTTEPAAPSAAAERMRRHRQRRRDGLRCFMIELRETEIDRLIKNGLLAAESL